MTLRLRQICLVAPTLEPAVSTLCDVLGIAVCYRDKQVGKYGLENAVMPVGNTFLEVVAPTQEATAAGRYIVRRKGGGGYMTILDCDAIDPWIGHLASVGVRVANDLDYPGEYRGLQLHPRDTGGTLLEINWTPGGAPDGAYHPAGPDWFGAKGEAATAAITAAEIQADDPAALARRWSDILRRPVHDADGARTIALDGGTLRFVPDRDERGEGLGGIDVRVADRAKALSAAAARGIAVAQGELALCGMRVRLVD
jgi:hypothetical protein